MDRIHVYRCRNLAVHQLEPHGQWGEAGRWTIHRVEAEIIRRILRGSVSTAPALEIAGRLNPK